MSIQKLLLATLVVAVIISVQLTAGNTKAATPTNSIWQQDLNVAWKQAKEAKKPLVLYFTSNHCYFCEKMMKETYANRQVSEQLSSSFVPTLIRADRHPNMVRKLGISVFPTTVIVSPEAKVLAAMTGFVKADELQRQLNSARTRAAQADQVSRR